MASAYGRVVYSLLCIILITAVSAQDDLECPKNITQNAIYGDENVTVSWPDMTQNGSIDVMCSIEGRDIVSSGDEFPVGVTVVTCMNDTSVCTFTINVTECRPCDNGDNQNETCACECNEFYEGLLCDECRPCDNGDNQNETCACECNDFYEGLLCDVCTKCVNGTNQDVDNCACECFDLYNGTLCDDCGGSVDSCENGGNFTESSCTCACPQPFSGKTCTECIPKNCTNGGKLNNVTCECDCLDDFQGELCAECSPKECLNGEQLINTTCKCDCLEGFEGELCTDCTAEECGNNGQWNASSCECDCLEGFEGELCADCTAEECGNNGQWNASSCECDCLQGFEGDLCADCIAKECRNNGQWNALSCECDCLEGFEGELCAECIPNSCTDRGQLNNMTCECDCFDGFIGELCADCKNCSNNGGNQNSSTCACECTELYQGLLCEDCASCKNGGLSQNQFTCECDCPGFYTGPLCTVCPQWLSCMNGGTLDEEKCFCECTSDWKGKDCSEAVPSFPDDQYPSVEGEKKIQIEIALTSSDGPTGVCNVTANSTSEECKSLVEKFIKEVETEYQRLAGFKKVSVDQEKLREGSVIVPHEAIYDYATMSQEGRQLSARALYDMTIGKAVSQGKIGELGVSSCPKCVAPKDLTDICNTNFDCGKGLKDSEMYTDDGSCYLICQSLCKSEYTSCGEGTCNQEQGSDVITCKCPQTSSMMYIGKNCQLRIELLWLYVGCGIGGGVLLLLIIVLVACVIRCSNENKKLKKGHGGKNTDNELRGEVLAVHNNGFVGDTSTADDERGNTSSLTRARPYSYIYGKEDGANGVSRSNSGAAQRNSRYEATVYREQQQDVDELARLNQQQRSSYFWGNLSDPVKEDTELIPMVRGIDPSKMYKIQRPQISMSKHDDLPDRDYF